jgi:2-phosphosulfolactate phosphatase
MSESGRLAVHVHLLPSLIPPGALEGGVAVVVDVLRATTVMVHALAAGCQAIVSCGEIEEAKTIAAGLPPGTALLAGERQGLPIPGFDLGNSPGDFTPEVCNGKTLVMTTTNGTRAILASRGASRVLVAAFSNLEATVATLKDVPGAVHVVCAGTEGWISLEDTLLAGAIALGLEERGAGNDETLIATGLWRGQLRWVEDEAIDLEQPLFHLLGLGRGGRRVREIGLQADIREAARMTQHPFTARLWPDAMRILRG